MASRYSRMGGARALGAVAARVTTSRCAKNGSRARDPAHVEGLPLGSSWAVSGVDERALKRSRPLGCIQLGITTRKGTTGLQPGPRGPIARKGVYLRESRRVERTHLLRLKLSHAPSRCDRGRVPL